MGPVGCSSEPCKPTTLTSVMNTLPSPLPCTLMRSCTQSTQVQSLTQYTEDRDISHSAFLIWMVCLLVLLLHWQSNIKFMSIKRLDTMVSALPHVQQNCFSLVAIPSCIYPARVPKFSSTSVSVTAMYSLTHVWFSHGFLDFALITFWDPHKLGPALHLSHSPFKRTCLGQPCLASHMHGSVA